MLLSRSRSTKTSIYAPDDWSARFVVNQADLRLDTDYRTSRFANEAIRVMTQVAVLPIATVTADNEEIRTKLSSGAFDNVVGLSRVDENGRPRADCRLQPGEPCLGFSY